MTINKLREIIERLDGNMLVVIPDGEHHQRYHTIGSPIIQFSENFGPIFVLISNEKHRVTLVGTDGKANQPMDHY